MNQKLTEEKSLNHYLGRYNSDDQYEFFTKNGIKYTIVLFDIPSLNEYHFGENVFDFHLIAENDNPPKDYKVGNTVVHLLESVLIENEHHIITFVCDFSDLKHTKRKNTFTRWFKNSKIKSDFQLAFIEKEIDDSGLVYIFGIIYSKNIYNDSIINDIDNTISNVRNEILSQKN